MTYISSSSGMQRAKWRAQAIEIAKTLKLNLIQPKAADGKLAIGVAFDDGMVNIKIDPAHIEGMTHQQLTEHVYQLVITQAGLPGGITPLETIAKGLGLDAPQEKGTLQ